MKILPVFLAVVLYLLILYLRIVQGGFEPRIDLFKTQRDLLDLKIAQFLPSPQAELLSGILLGQNKNLPVSLKLALRDTSTLHIVVASGQNLSMVGGLFLGIAGLIKRRNAIGLSLLAVIFYTLLTGFQLPILRAAIMFIFASLGQLFGRERDGSWILLVTVLLMLLVNPGWISNISFQLSVLATFGVIVVAPVFLKLLEKLPVFGSDLAVSLAAQLMVTPVIVQSFHQFSIVGLIANALILWTVSFVMIGGGLILFLAIFSNFLAGVVALFVNILLTYFIYIVQYFSSLSFAWQYVGEQSWIFWLGYYLLLAGGLTGLHRKLTAGK